MKRLAIIASHPVQYYAPWFRTLADKEHEIDLRVFYLWDFGVTRRHDVGFGQALQWDVPLLEGYKHEFVPNVASDPGTHHRAGLRNPTLRARVSAWEPQAVLLMGYTWHSMMHFLLRWDRSVAPLLLRGDSHDLARTHGPRYWLTKQVAKFLFRRLDAFLACGKANKDYFLSRGASAENIFYCPHAVDMERFHRTPEILVAANQLRKSWEIPQDHRVVLFAGKFEEKKRPLDLLRAFQKIDPPLTILVFVGSGELEEPLHLASTGDARVRIMPFTNQSLMPAVYSAADLFVLPSAGPSETWGLAVQEALACDTPALVSDHVGCHLDLIQTGFNGAVFSARETGALEKALREALVPGVLEGWQKHTRRSLDQYTTSQATAGLKQALDFLT